MQHNIKVDVIYYLSPSDFEMEFNLCGCCHMRLLNEKTQDKQGLVKALAKAVSRSKVIIICGPLFDDNGLIKTVSTAIGKNTEVIKNNDYGIKFDDEISVIEGATPLVTPEGFFGGCIIESGPQAIIVLSESKGIRKIIMNNLVHQYIYELSLLSEDALAHSEAKEEKEEAVMEETVAEETDAEAQDTNEEVSGEENGEVLEYEDISSTSEPEEEKTEEDETDITEETQEDIAAETEQETVEDTAEEQTDAIFVLADEDDETEETEETPTPFSPIEMYIDPQHISPKKVSDYAKNYVPSEKDSLFISGDEYDYDMDDDGDFVPLPKIKFSIIIIAIILCLIAVVLLYLMVYIPYSKGIDYSVYIEQIFGPASNI